MIDQDPDPGEKEMFHQFKILGALLFCQWMWMLSIVLTDNTDTSSYCEETYNYIGCTRSSIHSRMLGHKRGQKSKLKSNPLYRHDCDYHSGDPQ